MAVHIGHSSTTDLMSHLLTLTRSSVLLSVVLGGLGPGPWKWHYCCCTISIGVLLIAAVDGVALEAWQSLCTAVYPLQGSACKTVLLCGRTAETVGVCNIGL